MTTLIEDVTLIGAIDTQRTATTPPSSTITAVCLATGSSRHLPEEDKTKLFDRAGLEQLHALADGRPPAPISSHIGLEFVSVADGDVVMTAQPDESHYVPIGSVHGGFFATVFDSVAGCPVHSTLPAGVGYTSLEIKISFLRPITAGTGAVTAHGWVTRRGKSAAFAEADTRDSEGRVLATASSTCLVVHPDPAR